MCAPILDELLCSSRVAAVNRFGFAEPTRGGPCTYGLFGLIFHHVERTADGLSRLVEIGEDAIADHLVENDGVITEADWVALTEDVFGTIEYPFGDKNIALFKSFFPDAIVHVKGEAR